MQTKHLASLLTLGVALASIPVMPSYAQEVKIPTLYELQNQQVKVTYSTTSLTGEARLDYQDQEQRLQFSGDEIRTTETEIGKLVTVTIYKTIDTGSVTFSLLLPDVNLKGQNEARIVAQGITNVNRFSTIPLLNEGQRQTYTVLTLYGTAEAVAF